MMLALSWPPRQRYTHLGDFRLENGDTISELVIGYAPRASSMPRDRMRCLSPPGFKAEPRMLRGRSD